MSVVSWLLTIYYSVTLVALVFTFGLWFTTKKNEDVIWRFIFGFIFSLIFVSVFWLTYWFGTTGAWPLVWLSGIVAFVWLFVVFGTRSESFLYQVVFSLFGMMVISMIAIGGYTAGERGWWGMAIPLYVLSFVVPYSLLVPD